MVGRDYINLPLWDVLLNMIIGSQMAAWEALAANTITIAMMCEAG